MQAYLSVGTFPDVHTILICNAHFSCALAIWRLVRWTNAVRTPKTFSIFGFDAYVKKKNRPS